MNKYQPVIKAYYNEVVTPKFRFWEVCIVLVSIVTILFSFYLQIQDHTLLSMLNMLIAAVGLKHVMNNDERRKLNQIKRKYEKFCAASSASPIKPSSILAFADARKAWFCMAHRVDSKELIEVAMSMKAHYAAYRELESLNGITYGEVARLIFWFDTGRLVSLLAIIAALVSVVLLAGVNNVDPIIEAFFLDVFPRLVLIAGFLFVGYFALVGLAPVLPAVLGAFDVVQVSGNSQVSDRAIRNYIYCLMRASD